MTGKEMCEKIAAFLKQRTGQEVDPRVIWNLSPLGELWPVYALYRDCIAAGMQP